MEKSERPKASKHEHGVDLMSNMPDGILLSILSRLPSTEEAIRTSVLSRRWRYVWTSVPSIHIRYGGNLTGNDFKEFVYWVLLNNSVDLDRFHLCCSDHYSILTVERWIHAAVARNVKKVELTFRPNVDIGGIKMPHCLVTCGSLEVLRLNLKGRGLRLPKIIGFPALRVLSLIRVNLLDDGNLVKAFLESCKLLEDLTLLGCLIDELDHLCISCPNLKKLRIGNMYVYLCEDIKISCPKLVELTLRGHIAYNYFFESLDSLKKAIIEPLNEPNFIDYSMSVLFPGICHVEFLLIDFFFFCKCINAASDLSLPNLKTLMISATIPAFNFDEFSRILKHYPKLESLKLIIKGEFFELGLWERVGGDERGFMTPDLERVELLEFNGEKPKVVMDWDEITLMGMEFSWGKKSKYPD